MAGKSAVSVTMATCFQFFAVFFHLGDVFVQIAPAQNTAVDFRMQGFHAAVEHFGETGVVGNFNHGNARIGKQLRRAAGREDFDTELGQGLGKFDCARLVGQADQGAFDGRHRDFLFLTLGWETVMLSGRYYPLFSTFRQ